MQSAKNQKTLQTTGFPSKIGLILYLAAVISNPLQAEAENPAISSAPQIIRKGSRDSFSPDSTLLASSDTKNAVLRMYNILNRAGKELTVELMYTINGASFNDFSPDGTMIALTGFHSHKMYHNNMNTYLFDASTGESIRVIENSLFAGFSPDGSLLTRKPDCEETISGSWHQISSPGFILWNTTTGERIREFEGERYPAFSPDGTMLAIGTTNADTHYQDVLLYNVSTGEHIRTFEGEYPLFSSDGSTIATDIRGHLDNYIEGALWNVATGELIYTFKGQHLDFIPQPEGDLLVLTAWNSHVRKDGLTVWNIKTGELVLTLDNTWNNDSNHDAIMQALQTTDTATPGKKANLRDFTTGEVKRTYREEDRPGFAPKDSFAKYLSDKCKDPVWIIAAGLGIYAIGRACALI